MEQVTLAVPVGDMEAEIVDPIGHHAVVHAGHLVVLVLTCFTGPAHAPLQVLAGISDVQPGQIQVCGCERLGVFDVGLNGTERGGGARTAVDRHVGTAAMLGIFKVDHGLVGQCGQWLQLGDKPFSGSSK